MELDPFHPRANAMLGLLLIGLFCNFAVKPVDEESYMVGEQLDAERRLAAEARKEYNRSRSKASARSWVLATLAWLSVGVPLLWGIYQTLKLAWQIF